jgi:energy-converting hydrogenase Eha subunit C
VTDHRPQYGELATPEEQRRAAGLPPIEETVPVEPGAQSAPSASERTRPDVPQRPHPIDRLVTIGLLAYGLVNVIVTGLSYLDPTAVMNQTMAMLGISGEFTNFAQGKLWGTIAAVVLAVGWAATAALSIRRLRRGRITWWLPLVGAVVTLGVASMCIAVPMMGDPAFVAHMEGIARG